MDADRACFVCQSISSNRFISDFNKSKITSMSLTKKEFADEYTKLFSTIIQAGKPKLIV